MKISILITVLIFLLTGCMSKPKIQDYPKTMTAFEIKIAFKYDKCVYAQSHSEIDLKCYEILNDIQKIEYILLYSKLEKNGKLPIIYRKNSDEIMTFDDFFKYIK